jgi:SAM-dependent methyltransferase
MDGSNKLSLLLLSLTLIGGLWFLAPAIEVRILVGQLDKYKNILYSFDEFVLLEDLMFDTLSDREKAAVAYYDEMIRRGDITDRRVWVDDFSGRVFWGFGRNDEVVDIGCRIGRYVPLLPELHIAKYLGIDPSAESIEYCKRTFSSTDEYQVAFEVGEARLLGDKYPGRFSGFMLTAVLMHIPRTDLATVLSSVRKCLKSGSPGFFSTPLAEDGDETEVVNQAGMEISLYTEQELDQAFIEAGFKFHRKEYPGQMILGHVYAI